MVRLLHGHFREGIALSQSHRQAQQQAAQAKKNAIQAVIDAYIATDPADRPSDAEFGKQLEAAGLPQWLVDNTLNVVRQKIARQHTQGGNNG